MLGCGNFFLSVECPLTRNHLPMPIGQYLYITVCMQAAPASYCPGCSVTAILLICLPVIMTCMTVPRCPLRKLYSHKVEVAATAVVRTPPPGNGGGDSSSTFTRWRGQPQLWSGPPPPPPPGNGGGDSSSTLTRWRGQSQLWSGPPQVIENRGGDSADTHLIQ